jgi:hypothetical protein
MNDSIGLFSTLQMRKSGIAADFTADVGQRFDLFARFRQVDIILFGFFEI